MFNKNRCDSVVSIVNVGATHPYRMKRLIKGYIKNFVKQDYFPETFDKPSVFYIPGNEGREKFLKERLEKLWEDRYK